MDGLLVRPPPCMTTPEKGGANTSRVTDESLVEPPDPNLCCAICYQPFTRPMRTACGHIFCDACVQTWLPLKSECPECRAPMRAEELSPDRLAERLTSNLDAFCQFRKAGCTWVGKRGSMTSHLARECPCVPVICPNAGCGAEMARSELDEHAQSCTAARAESRTACPYGCGACIADSELPAHQAECLYDPRKLMAAVSQLSRENQRLTLENQQLRDEAAVGDAGGRARKPARRRTGPGMCAE